MNRWAIMLADAPPTLQRLIARRQRISLPRGCSAEERVARLRAGLCHARTVRELYFALPPEAQAALQELRAVPRGLSLDDLAARFGPLRPWSQIAADFTAQSLSERLVLLGLLLPRPATHRHPTRFLLPPEVRAALPRPLALPDHGPAPESALPLALRAARSALLAVAERPLPVRADGSPRKESLRLLAARLAQPEEGAAVLCRWLWPLLIDLGLLAPHGACAALAPAGQRFLARSAREQQDLLRSAWVRSPRSEGWLCDLGVAPRGLNWPLLRQRLLAWAAALPAGRLLEPAILHGALADALGPLADAQTHGFRHTPPDRTPWQPKSAAAVWETALRGPLAWLGAVAWTDDQCPTTNDQRPTTNDEGSTTNDTPTLRWVFRPPTDAEDLPTATETTEPWEFGIVGEVRVRQDGQDGAVLGLLPFARFAAADATATIYQINKRTLADATRAGHAVSALRSLLQRQAGPVPSGWDTLLGEAAPAVRVVHAAVVTSTDPAVLSRAAGARSVRRYLGARLAPGIALVEPERAAGLVRTLKRQDLAVEERGAPEVAPPSELTPAECAVLLAVCADYRALVAPEALPPAVAALEDRLRAALPRTLAPPAARSPQPLPAQDTGTAPGPLDDGAGLDDPLPGGQERESGTHPTDYLAPLRTAIARQRLVRIRYQAPEKPPSERTIRPLLLEHHADCWYVRAYCMLAQAERQFRLDRIASLTPLKQRSPRMAPARRAAAPPPAAPRRTRRPAATLGTGLFPPPPPPPPGSPLVRVWLADDPPHLPPALAERSVGGTS
jgi:hypothetical protein